jgi:hypothetical protein
MMKSLLLNLSVTITATCYMLFSGKFILNALLFSPFCVCHSATLRMRLFCFVCLVYIRLPLNQPWLIRYA